MARIAPKGMPCTGANCSCCEQWQEITSRALSLAERLAHLASISAGENAAKDEIIQLLQAAEATLADESASKDDTICTLQANEATLVEDNKQLAKANKDLNAQNNGIHTVPDEDRVSTGRVGRPSGQEATINKRPEQIDREEVVDIKECPKGHALSETITDQYDRVVKVRRIITENVKYTVYRRCARSAKSSTPQGRPMSLQMRAFRPTSRQLQHP